MSPSITGGNVIKGGTVIAGAKDRVYKVNGAATDANVGGGYFTPANGTLAEDLNTGQVYERQAGVWTRIDTITPHPN
jgi:hypothetical protein